MIHSHADFMGENPPPRIGGGEREYGVNDDLGKPAATLIGKMAQRETLSAMGVKLVDKHVETGAKLHKDDQQFELSTSEALGPAAIVKEIKKGEVLVGKIADSLKEYKLHVFNRTGHLNKDHEDRNDVTWYTSRGDHDNLLTIPGAMGIEGQKIISSLLATRPIISGAGMLWIPENEHEGAFRFSQKAFDISDVSNNQTTAARKKAMIKIHAISGDQGAGSQEFPRVETRCTDALHSPWAQWMGFATLSLTLRILEHKNIFTKQELSELSLLSPDRSLHQTSADFDMSMELHGSSMTAIEHQRQFAELAFKLNEYVDLPFDESLAITEWMRALDDLERYKLSSTDSFDRDESIVSDRLEWAGRLHHMKNRLAKSKLGNMAINRSNSEANRIDVVWDKIYPRGLAQYWWVDQVQTLPFDPETLTTKNLELNDEYLKAPPTRAEGRAGLIHEYDDRIVSMSWDRASLRDGSMTFEQIDPYNPIFVQKNVKYNSKLR